MGTGEKYNFGNTSYSSEKQELLSRLDELLHSILNDKIKKSSDVDTEVLKIKSPLNVPQKAKITKQKKDSYIQVKYEWKNNGSKYEMRWHTPTPDSPETQPTWQGLKTIPGTKTKQKQQFHLIMDNGKNRWIPHSVWVEAIKAKKAGKATIKQKELIDNGHIKDN